MKHILLLFVLTFTDYLAFAQKINATEINKIETIRHLTNKALKEFNITEETNYYTDNYCITTGLGNTVVGKDNYINYYKDDKSGLYIRTPKEITISSLDTLAYKQAPGLRKKITY
jgi:hypothetical protein